MKLKNILLSGLSLVLVAALAIGGTVAYLQDDDSDVNVMTLGNVKIEQNEYQRVIENGTYKIETINGEDSYVLEPFEQAKPLLPVTEVDANGAAINHGAGAYGSTKLDMTQVGSQGLKNMFTTKNVQDKIVTVKNTGKSDAYVRTWIALEDPFTEGRIGVNVGSNGYTQDPYWIPVVIDGVQYSVSCFTYNAALKPGEVSTPSLLQVYLNYKATNEDMELLGDTYEILAFSQAVQADGFADAATALKAAFGTDHPWANGVSIPVTVATADELSAALAAGGNIVVADDVNLSQRTKISNAATIDLAGNTLTAEKVNGFDDVLYVRTADGVTLKNGTVKSENGYAVTVGHSGNTITGVLTIESGTYIGQSTVVQLGYGELIIKGGYFEAKPYNGSYEYTINCIDTSYNNGTAKVTIIGGTFFNFNPADNASEGAGTNYVPDGYKVISEQDSNGNTLYTVVAE